jgi:positive regulator of sigma E activity
LQRGSAPEVDPSKSPVRDTLLVYGVLSLIILLVAWLTGGSLGRALVIVPIFYVIASAWTIQRLRARARREAASKEAP